MCGIVSLINGETVWNKASDLAKWFNQALFVDTVRGMDSTGIAAVPHNLKDDVKVIKETLPGHMFIQLGSVQKLIDNTEKYKYLIGHNRAATKGKASDPDNAHPFDVGDYVGVHNGTLTQYHNLCKKVTGTDSEAIYHSFVDRGVHKTLEQLTGAFALVWYDAINESYNFIRNSERPLVYATLKSHKGLLVASESGMLTWLASRNGVSINNVVLAKEGVLHTIYGTDVDNIHTETINIKEPTPYNYGGYSYPTYDNKSKGKGHVSLEERFREQYKSEFHLNEITFTPLSFDKYSSPSVTGKVDGKLFGKVKFCDKFEGKNIFVRVYMLEESIANTILESKCDWRGEVVSIYEEKPQGEIFVTMRASSLKKDKKKELTLVH